MMRRVRPLSPACGPCTRSYLKRCGRKWLVCPLSPRGISTLREASSRKALSVEILVGGQHAVPHDVFPPEASYVALGHLHKAQAVGRDTVRYSGSLIPLSATEQPYLHGVTLVSLDGVEDRV